LARAAYEEAVRLDPLFAEAHNWLGNVHSCVGRRREAIACFSKAIEIDPNCAQAYAWRGDSYLSSGRNEAALSDYGKALSLAPEDTAALNNRACAYRRSHKYDLAIADLDRLIALKPAVAHTYLFRGMCHEQDGDKSAARRDYETAIRMEHERQGGGNGDIEREARKRLEALGGPQQGHCAP